MCQSGEEILVLLAYLTPCEHPSSWERLLQDEIQERTQQSTEMSPLRRNVRLRLQALLVTRNWAILLWVVVEAAASVMIVWVLGSHVRCCCRLHDNQWYVLTTVGCSWCELCCWMPPRSVDWELVLSSAAVVMLWWQVLHEDGVRLTVDECVELVVGYQLVQYLERRMIYGGEDLLQVVAKSAAYLAD